MGELGEAECASDNPRSSSDPGGRYAWSESWVCNRRSTASRSCSFQYARRCVAEQNCPLVILRYNGNLPSQCKHRMSSDHAMDSWYGRPGAIAMLRTP